MWLAHSAHTTADIMAAVVGDLIHANAYTTLGVPGRITAVP
jgi:hypothetical protein